MAPIAAWAKLWAVVPAALAENLDEIAAGIPLAEIADRYGDTVAVARRWVTNSDQRAVSRRSGPPRARRVDAERIVALYTEGRTQEQVAAAVGCSVDTVKRYVQEAGVARRGAPIASRRRRHRAALSGGPIARTDRQGPRGFQVCRLQGVGAGRGAASPVGQPRPGPKDAVETDPKDERRGGAWSHPTRHRPGEETPPARILAWSRHQRGRPPARQTSVTCPVPAGASTLRVLLKASRLAI